MGFGLDYFDRVPQSKLSDFKSSGVSFICRYYCPQGGSSKLLTKREAQEISSFGIEVVPVYEWGGNSPAHFTYSNGKMDCQQAIGRATEIGQPFNTTIYFAVDADMENSLSDVYNYFKGVSEAMNDYYHQNGHKWDIGIYAGYGVIEYMYGKFGVYHLWQAKGWEYNRGVYSRANMHQKEIDVKFFDIWVDKNDSFKTTGGFKI